ncbi:MAG: alpha/beta hydrolase [Desulfobacterales bacterium]|nr:alpha/beta hydrolase [Desulfobacterales bacterium]
MQGLFVLIGLGLCAYGAVMLVVYLSQEGLLFYPNLPSRSLSATPARINLDFEEVQLFTPDKVKLHGWFVPAPLRATDSKVILFFHGNAGNISHRLDSIRIFHDLGLAVLIIDYRGYGQSEGTISEPGLYLDGEAAWLHLTRDRNYAPRDIVIFGRSLGGAIATHLARGRRPHALIIESAFTSVPDIAASLYPFLPVRWLSKYKLDIRKLLAGVACPVLVVHSRDDDIIPYSHGRRLFDAARPPKQFLELRGDHNQGFLLSGPHYSDGVRRFLEKVSDGVP